LFGKSKLGRKIDAMPGKENGKPPLRRGAVKIKRAFDEQLD
jgi:hypothetical protein